MKTKKQIYADAAAAIQTYGHHKQNYGAPEIGMCVYGAIRWAMFGNTKNPGSQDIYSQEAVDLYRAISDEVEAEAARATGLSGAVTFNDRDTTTKQDAIDFLNRLATAA